jgi:hypothetical protein
VSGRGRWRWSEGVCVRVCVCACGGGGARERDDQKYREGYISNEVDSAKRKKFYIQKEEEGAHSELELKGELQSKEVAATSASASERMKERRKN